MVSLPSSATCFEELGLRLPQPYLAGVIERFNYQNRNLGDTAYPTAHTRRVAGLAMSPGRLLALSCFVFVSSFPSLSRQSPDPDALNPIFQRDAH
jgi:hypothetical protein